MSVDGTTCLVFGNGHARCIPSPWINFQEGVRTVAVLWYWRVLLEWRPSIHRYSNLTTKHTNHLRVPSAYQSRHSGSSQLNLEWPNVLKLFDVAGTFWILRPASMRRLHTWAAHGQWADTDIMRTSPWQRPSAWRTEADSQTEPTTDGSWGRTPRQEGPGRLLQFNHMHIMYEDLCKTTYIYIYPNHGYMTSNLANHVTMIGNDPPGTTKPILATVVCCCSLRSETPMRSMRSMSQLNLTETDFWILFALHTLWPSVSEAECELRRRIALDPFSSKGQGTCMICLSQQEFTTCKICATTLTCFLFLVKMPSF